MATATCTSKSGTALRKALQVVAPMLSKDMHKGQCGRICVFGGSIEYTGAPYFAAISALKAGADMSYVVCPKDAVAAIKSYSPDLIVYPTLCDSSLLRSTLDTSLASRLHSVVLGPGFGRAEDSFENFKTVLNHCKSQNIPIVIDADGLYFVCKDVDLVRNYKSLVLTPNVVEFGRLYNAVFNKEPDSAKDAESVKRLCTSLGGISIVQKGECDIISDGSKVLICDSHCSARRCGGQGDLLSGSLGTFLHWTSQATLEKDTVENPILKEFGPTLLASYGACLLTKECNRIAFEKYGRSMITGNMVDSIHLAMKNIFVD